MCDRTKAKTIDTPTASCGVVVACWLLSACVSFRARPPEGFAELEDNGAFRAVTPEGVIFRVREVDNEPRADLDFWRAALEQRMEDAGYLFVAEREVEAAGVRGYLLELAAPFGEQDFNYLVALFVRDDELTVIEVAGEVSHVQKRHEAILEAIRSLHW